MTLTTIPQATAATTELSCGTRDAAAACVDVLREVVAELDPDAMLASEAPEVWGCFDQVEKLSAAAKMLLARKIDESRIWEGEGMRDAAEYLALRGGTTREAARNSLQVSTRLPKLPAVQAAVRRGELSAAQAHPIADAASDDPAAERRLLDYAKTASLKELRDECLRTKAAADPDPEGRRRRIHKGRYFRQYTDAEGAWRFSGRGTIENGSVFTAALDLLVDQIFKKNAAKNSDSEPEPREALAFDAVIQMARQAWAAAHGHTPHQPPSTEDASSTEGINDGAPGTDNAAGATRPVPGDLAVDDDPGQSTDSSDDDGTHTSPTSVDNPDRQVDQERPGDPATPEGDGAEHSDPGGDDHGGLGLPADVAQLFDREGQHDDLPDPTGNRTGVGAAPSGTATTRPPGLTRLRVLRLDLEALRRGHVVGGELCEVSGLGALTVDAARELLTESAIKLVITNGNQVLHVAHVGQGHNGIDRISPQNGPLLVLEGPRTRPLAPPPRRTPGPPTHLAILRADIAAIERRSHPGDQTCEIPGVGPLSLPAARKLLGASVLELARRRGVAVSQTIHPGRQPTVAQRVALLWAQPSCSVAGCAHTFTQIDHRHDWHRVKVTELDNLDRLCGHHHRLKTHEGWTPVQGTGKRAFVPPTSHRHATTQAA